VAQAADKVVAVVRSKAAEEDRKSH